MKNVFLLALSALFFVGCTDGVADAGTDAGDAGAEVSDSGVDGGDAGL